MMHLILRHESFCGSLGGEEGASFNQLDSQQGSQ
jgi:hypothetical protein